MAFFHRTSEELLCKQKKLIASKDLSHTKCQKYFGLIKHEFDKKERKECLERLTYWYSEYKNACRALLKILHIYKRRCELLTEIKNFEKTYYRKTHTPPVKKHIVHSNKNQ